MGDDDVAAYEKAARAHVAVQELEDLLRGLDVPRLLGYAEVAEAALVAVWRALQGPVAQEMDRRAASKGAQPPAD